MPCRIQLTIFKFPSFGLGQASELLRFLPKAKTFQNNTGSDPGNEEFMTEFQLQIAGKTVTVHAMFDSTKEFCRDYLHTGPADFLVETNMADISFEREKSAREDELEGLPTRKYSDRYLETIAVQRKIVEELFSHDTLLFHGSVVAVDGQAYLFTARSGTGKSTHTRLWRKVFGSRAVMVNDDKPLLSITAEGILVYGTPWNGKHHLGENICVPLKAICLLERGEENRIREIASKGAIPMLVQQSSRPRNPRLTGKYLELLDAIARQTTFYRLECNMESSAAHLAYEVMSGERKHK